jgi:hypothetical protein
LDEFCISDISDPKSEISDWNAVRLACSASRLTVMASDG